MMHFQQFFIGTINEVNNGREVLGWVQNPETGLDWHWWQTKEGGPSVGTQYVAAISMGMRQVRASLVITTVMRCSCAVRIIGGGAPGVALHRQRAHL